MILLNGFRLHKLKFFVSFLPPGSPVAILPFLIIIEFISFNARAFSLAIRLFANMMSGHILLKIISGAILGLLVLLPQSAIITIFPFIFLFIITGLEFVIAFLQAYVFVTLVCIYFNESFNLH
jgi:ATP synthase subunit 6